MAFVSKINVTVWKDGQAICVNTIMQHHKVLLSLVCIALTLFLFSFAIIFVLAFSRFTRGSE